jgi:endonuclease YncB( thermonuclease family)
VPSSIGWDDTVPFVPPVKHGRVIKVYDGDTITVAAALPFKGSRVYRFSVRLNGIDTPEMRTSDDSEKAIAVKAKKALSELILGKWVELRNTDNDKYGRLLADVWFQGTHVNKWMIDNRFAVAYDGGTKETPDDWRVYYRGGPAALRESQQNNELFIEDKDEAV